MRLQLALNVEDLEAAIAFYSKLFGVTVNKRKPGYANFVISQPPLKLVLFEQPELTNQLNHLGVEVFDDAQVETAAAHMRSVGLNPEVENAQTCCFATQNKAVTYDPDGTMWEWYRVIEDADGFYTQASEPEPSRSACC